MKTQIFHHAKISSSKIYIIGLALVGKATKAMISLVVQSSMKPKLSNKQNCTLKISSYTKRTSNVYHIPTLADAT
jgi:hypothetical protein